MAGGTAHLWELLPRGDVRVDLGKDSATGLCLSPDGKFVAAGLTRAEGGGRRNELVIWDAHTGTELHRLKAFAHEIKDVTYTPTGTRVAAIGADVPDGPALVRSWDARTGLDQVTLSGPPYAPNWVSFGMAYSPDGRHVFVGGAARVHMLDATTGAEVRAFTSGAPLATHPTLPWLLEGGSGGGMTAVADYSTGTVIHSTKVRAKVGAFSPDGSIFALANRNGIAICNSQTGNTVLAFTAHAGFINGIGFTPDGRRLLSASTDGTVGVWDSHTGQLFLRLDDQPGEIVKLALSREGGCVASVSKSGSLVVRRGPSHKVSR